MLALWEYSSFLDLVEKKNYTAIERGLLFILLHGRLAMP